MDGIVLLDHLDAGSTVLCDLVDVRAFHEAHADIGVPQAVGRARLTVTVQLEAGSFQQVVEQFDMVAGKHLVGRLRECRDGGGWRCTTFLLP